jgi:hypothetical protein
MKRGGRRIEVIKAPTFRRYKKKVDKETIRKDIYYYF